MPRRGESMPEHQRADHARAMRAPLVPVASTILDPQMECWREVLVCGHKGQWVSKPWGDWKPRRRCQACKTEPAAGHEGEK